MEKNFTQLLSKKVFIIGYAITGILVICSIAYLDKNTDRSVYMAAIGAISGIAGIHNFVQGKVDEKKEGAKDATDGKG